MKKESLGEGLRIAGVIVAVVLVALLVGCATSKPNWIDRTFYNVQTNYVPHVFVETNTVFVTNTVPVIVERTNIVADVSATGALLAIRTNTVTVTNEVKVVTLETNVYSRTNVVPQIELSPKPGAEESLRAAGGIAGAPWGLGGVFGSVLAGGYITYMQMRNRKISAGFVQQIETARELLTSTPQGEKLNAEYTAWLIQHQKAAGVLGAVSSIVDKFVDNKAARDAVTLITSQLPKTPA